jgi:hypothetical protein
VSTASDTVANVRTIFIELRPKMAANSSLAKCCTFGFIFVPFSLSIFVRTIEFQSADGPIETMQVAPTLPSCPLQVFHVPRTNREAEQIRERSKKSAGPDTALSHKSTPVQFCNTTIYNLLLLLTKTINNCRVIALRHDGFVTHCTWREDCSH